MKKFVFILIILAAFALRMWHIDTESLWHDEGWSIRAIEGPFTTPDDNTPFVYYLTGHLLWRAGAGESALAYRYVSVLIGTLTVALTILLARRWFGITAAVGVGVLVACNPLLWDYAQEVRAYVAVPALGVLMLYGAGRLLTPPPSVHREGELPRPYITALALLWMVELVALYTHNLAVPLVVWLNVALGVVWLFRREWRSMFIWAGTQIALIVAYIPWLLTQSPSGTPLNTPPQIGLPLVRDIWASYFLPVLPQLQDAITDGGLLWTLVLVFGVVALISGVVGLIPSPPSFSKAGIRTISSPHPQPLSQRSVWERGVNRGSSPSPGGEGFRVRAWLKRTSANSTNAGRTRNDTQNLPLKRGEESVYSERIPPTDSVSFNDKSPLWEGSIRGEGYFLLLSHALLVPALSIALMLAANIDFHPRYLITAVPGTLLLIVGAWRSWIVPTALITVFGVLIAALSLHDIRTTREYQHDDFRALADYYATLPENAYILIPFDDEPALQYVFDDDIAAQMVNVPLYSDEATALDVIADLRGYHVELMTWFQLPADPRGMYPCVLGALSDRHYAPQTYFGMMTQRFDLNNVPAEFTDLRHESPFAPLTLQDLGYLGDERVCVRSEWTLNQPTEENIQVAASILNPLDAPIARDDSEIATPENVGTAAWSPGDTGQAYHLLAMPEGAPPRDYALSLNVYTPSQPEGFDVLDASGNPAGKDYQLDDTITAAGARLTQAITAPQLLDSRGETIETGIPLDVTLLLPDDGTLRDETVILRGDDWTVERVVPAVLRSQRAWVRFVVPPGNDGLAQLIVDNTVLAEYTVIDPPRLFDPPTFESSVDVAFVNTGVLIGADMPEAVNAGDPFGVTLVWQAGETPLEVAYTVFVQLIGDDGRVLAQSDAVPSRPTSAWVDGEYVVDTHTLRWNVDDYSGTATIIAGLYDPSNFRRVFTIDGDDHAGLPGFVQVGE